MTNDLPQPRHRLFAMLYDHLDRADDKRMRRLRDALLSGLQGTVLEVGAGTGANFEHYDWGGIAHLAATEPDPYMKQRAERKLAGLPTAARSKVSLLEAPAEGLPFDDEQFDAIVSCLVLCTVADLHRSLAEIRRVLKPGGEVRLLEHVGGAGTWRRVQGIVQPVYGYLLAGCRLDRDTESAVRNAGFTLEVSERTRFSPLHPAFLGVAKKKPEAAN